MRTPSAQVISEPISTGEKAQWSGLRERRFPFMGTLPEGALYVERTADRLVLEALTRGESCHVLAPRQIGKSSLRLRITRKLQEEEIRCASIDLTSIGSAETKDEWFFSFVDELSQRLGLRDPQGFWDKLKDTPPDRRFALYMRSVMAEELLGARVCVLIDEIEAIRLVPFSLDSFFMSIRAMIEEGAQGGNLSRLAFCFMGVSTPNDLISDKQVTPFNVSRAIHLDDFSRAEMDALMPGLEDLGVSAKDLLDAVYAWTDGHPYMTMRTCSAITMLDKIEAGQESGAVENAVREQFLAYPMEDPNLSYAARRFTDIKHERAEAGLMDRILLLRKVLKGEVVEVQNESAVQMELRLSGMIKAVKDDAGKGYILSIRNRIFGEVFDEAWLKDKGERRFLAEAAWKWRDSGRKDDFCLRGEALREMVEISKCLKLSDIEEEFLRCSASHNAAHKVEIALESLKRVQDLKNTILPIVRSATKSQLFLLRAYMVLIPMAFLSGAVCLVLSLKRWLDMTWITSAVIGVIVGGFLFVYFIRYLFEKLGDAYESILIAIESNSQASHDLNRQVKQIVHDLEHSDIWHLIGGHEDLKAKVKQLLDASQAESTPAQTPDNKK